MVLTVQGWTGDTVNLFTTFPSGTVGPSIGDVGGAISAGGAILVWHAAEGVLLFALSVVVLAMSQRSKPTSVRIVSILGFLAILSAGVGGLLFVLSGFQDNGASAQMGGSFIGAYAFYFIELYYTR